ncbi:deoxyribodipyrimidine photo-lyase [Shimia thalassica]|uniref:cryptochrome/photolyase family protein n=1 Tax=Shimia thalassica TaxID=1715693 RepID=UPI0027362C3C|nr:deoxyribodipyrimidine photo-lyase [Shimia thalassica]MDP2493099.1 deoxyribodipyrimidine photo-lyase [Shimia thalassica]
MTKAIHWFRRDLRLSDNPALTRAAKSGQVVPVYIHDDASPLGGASAAWLHRSLKALDDSLDGNLVLLRGNPLTIVPTLVHEVGATTVTWTRRYDPSGVTMDKSLKQALKAEGVSVHSENGALLWEPMDVNKADGTPYKVFTPFYRRGCQAAPPPRSPLAPPELELCKDPQGVPLSDLGLRDDRGWDTAMLADWTPGEIGARERLEEFLDGGLQGYKEGRNQPDKANVSRLSPHLHFGEISPNTVWHLARTRPSSTDQDHFLSELGWREFSHSILFHNPQIARQNLNPKYDAFPWREDAVGLRKWQQGQTGIPIIDAGMRELWQTGYMHNRVRMIVASFLVKNLMIHWRHGLRWFDDTLVDADPANNPASWQWVAGSGADAAPFFRIFNPVTQSEKFDSKGAYIRRFVPEVAALKDKDIHAPWRAPDVLLQAAGVTLGETYPHPIADLKDSRERALAAFKTL